MSDNQNGETTFGIVMTYSGLNEICFTGDKDTVRQIYTTLQDILRDSDIKVSMHDISDLDTYKLDNVTLDEGSKILNEFLDRRI